MSVGFKHGELTEQIIAVFFEVYNELGHGFLESVYEEAMIIALRERGFRVDQQVVIPVWFRGGQIGEFRADLVVEGLVVLELKAVRALDPAHDAQLLNELRATDKEVGLLFNFRVKPEFKRMAFDNTRKGPRKRIDWPQMNADDAD
ncbi:MAG: GxxExxY protein [Bacillota bacterium]